MGRYSPTRLRNESTTYRWMPAASVHLHPRPRGQGLVLMGQLGKASATPLAALAVVTIGRCMTDHAGQSRTLVLVALPGRLGSGLSKILHGHIEDTRLVSIRSVTGGS